VQQVVLRQDQVVRQGGPEDVQGACQAQGETPSGLANSTVRQSSLRAIENDAAAELEKATREYNRDKTPIPVISKTPTISCCALPQY
jgi:hypothetical protein